METKGEQNIQESLTDNFDRLEMKQYSLCQEVDIGNFGKAAECEGAGDR